MFQEDAVCLSTATLQGLRLVEIRGQHLEVQPLRLRINHPYRSARCDVDGLSNGVNRKIDSNKYTGSGSEKAFDMSVLSLVSSLVERRWSVGSVRLVNGGQYKDKEAFVSSVWISQEQDTGV